jgi:hypothetical protein
MNSCVQKKPSWLLWSGVAIYAAWSVKRADYATATFCAMALFYSALSARPADRAQPWRRIGLQLMNYAFVGFAVWAVVKHFLGRS